MTISNEASMRQHPLVRRMAVILIVKLIVLGGLLFAFFQAPGFFLPQPAEIEAPVTEPKGG